MKKVEKRKKLKCNFKADEYMYRTKSLKQNDDETQTKKIRKTKIRLWQSKKNQHFTKNLQIQKKIRQKICTHKKL